MRESALEEASPGDERFTVRRGSEERPAMACGVALPWCEAELLAGCRPPFDGVEAAGVELEQLRDLIIRLG